MIRRFYCCAALGALYAFASVSTAEEKPDHPHLRAALHELRDARNSLRDAKDNWPPGYKERALTSTQDAILSIKAILAIKDVENFRGVERSPDYYKQYSDHPQLRAALQDLREARQELAGSKANFGKLRERALDDIDSAVGDVLTLIRYKKQ